MRVLAIDPGPELSAWIVLENLTPVLHDIVPNADLIAGLALGIPSSDVVVIEQMESFGMPVGREVFETCRWAGRFEQAAAPIPVVLVPRREVKLTLCHDSRAKDTNVRAALLDLYGGSASTRKGGMLYGIRRDLWSALALAVTYVGRAERVA